MTAAQDSEPVLGLTLRGIAASSGTAIGIARRDDSGAPAGERNSRSLNAAEEGKRARHALDAVASELDALAGAARERGDGDAAEMIAASVVIAHDPELLATVTELIGERGLTAADALADAAERHAQTLDGVGDEHLAARAADIRSVGRRAVRRAALAAELPTAEKVGREHVLCAEDLGPADIAELTDETVAIVLAGGSASSHAAIVARSLGLPMVVAVGPALDEIPAGGLVAVDGSAGDVVVDPSAAILADRLAAVSAQRRQPDAGGDAGAVATTDGRDVAVLVNAAGSGEVRTGIRAGAAGVGLVRTEVSFLTASDWPSRTVHATQLERLLDPLPESCPATVRLLDFGGDKLPPFLAGNPLRGFALLLSEPEALAAQVGALGDVARGRLIRVMLPMVEAPSEVAAVRTLLADVGAPPVAVGAMIETVAALDCLPDLAAACDFLSIGTNDLSHAVLGTERFSAGAPTAAHHPAVLEAIERTVVAADARGIALEVCGEAASDPVTMPLLLGLGVRELSVGAALVGDVRRRVRSISYSEAQATARQACDEESADAVARLVRAVVT